MKTRETEYYRAHRGDALLKKWLQGDVTLEEELELFRLADSDAMLRDALEGYIGQKRIQPVKLAAPVAGKHIQVLTGGRSRGLRILLSLRYAAAAVALIAALSIAIIWTRNTGKMAVPVSVDVEDHRGSGGGPVDQIGSGDAEPGTGVEERIDREAGIRPSETSPNAGAGQGDRLNRREPGQTEAATADASANQISLEMPETGVDFADVPLPSEMSSGHSGQGEPEPIHTGETGSHGYIAQGEGEEDLDEAITLQYFDHEADEKLKREVQMEAIREGDEPITGYEINILSNISPDGSTENGVKGDPGMDGSVDQVGLQSITNLADASAASKMETRTNTIADKVVITQYNIQKRDITHPPIEDYNSLVRERYKRKAWPETGFYQYKKYLKGATTCLIDEHQNVEDLEEVVIKFRVFTNGSIEFIELFGAAGECADKVSAIITAGPKWEVAGHYESIDIEVPFKVLYPYWY